MADAEISAAAWESTQAEIDAQGGPSPDLDWQAVATAAGGSAAAAACAAYGAAAAAPLCSYVGAAVTGFVVDEVLPAIADAWDSIFGGDEPEQSLIELDDADRWLGYWRHMESADAVDRPIQSAIESLQTAAARIAPGLWTTETLIAWLEECGARFEWRGDVTIDNRQFGGMVETSYRPAPDAPAEIRIVPSLVTVPQKPVLVGTLWAPDWPSAYRRAHPFANDWQTLAAWQATTVEPWWANFYGVALPCLAARLQAEAIALAAELAAQAYRSEQLAELAALPPDDVQALRDWAALAALSPEDAQALRDWAALAALSELEREQLRALRAFGELSPAELAKVQAIGKVTAPGHFSRYGAAMAAPLGAM